ncbi:MAG: hypothetical protein ACJA16_001070 [Akkermansiaceae bacterium]|jgi:hypothetical protein
MLENKGGDAAKWSELALKFLNRSSNFSDMLDVFIARLHCPLSPD